MKKHIKILALLFFLVALILPAPKAQAQLAIAEIIKAGVKKVIKAIDLKIQREQNKIIWLQNAQKTLENTLSKLKLNEISDWTQKQKDLYQKYFNELQQVKTLITYYQRIRDISGKQINLVGSYNRAWSMLRSDKHFTPDEIAYMGRVYSGILSETVKNIDQMMLVVNSFTTQMTDAKRLEIINSAADNVDRNYSDLLRFNNQNALLSLKRSISDSEIMLVKKMYGLQ